MARIFSSLKIVVNSAWKHSGKAWCLADARFFKGYHFMRFVMHVGNSYSAATGMMHEKGGISIDWIFGQGAVDFTYENMHAALETIRKHHPITKLTCEGSRVCRVCNGTGQIASEG